jgi:hypothetical protein
MVALAQTQAAYDCDVSFWHVKTALLPSKQVSMH